LFTVTEERFFPASIVDEALYLAERAAGVPMIHGWIHTLEGEISSKAVQEALDACINYYPKFKCILVSNYPSSKRWFRYCWEYRDIKSRDILQEIEDPHMNTNGQGALTYYIKNHSSLSIDITCHVPIKVVLIRQPEQVNLIFVFHHAAVDGIGSFLFIQRFIQFYEEIFYQQKIWGDYTPDFRAISQPEIKPPWKHFSLRHFYGLRRGKALFLQEPSAQEHTQEGEEPVGKLRAVVREIPPHQFNTIRATAKKYQASFHNYLLAALFHTVKKWNQQHGEHSGCICINTPMNLRSSEDHTVGNIYSGFAISLRPELVDDRRKTLKLIREKQIVMIKNDVARTTLNLTWFLKIVPLKIKRLMLKHHIHSFYPSLGFTNLGVFSPNPSHKNEEGFHYMGPARICSISCIGIANPWPMVLVLTYNDRMAISLSVSRSRFSFEAAERFLDSFIWELIE